MIRRLQFVFLFVFLLSPVWAQQKGTLYYAGLADNGWQVYRWDFKQGKEVQMTQSPGDKRVPIWVPAMNKVVYKDAIGQICSVDASGKEEVLVKGVRTCAHFTITQDGQHIYYTRLLANNPLRQSLWHASAADGFSKPQLIFRMPRGSIRNVCIAPSGNEIAMSHVWRDNEERILLLDLEALKRDAGTSAQPVTPELITAAFPRYSFGGERLYFVKRVARGNYDLFAFDLKSKKTHPVLETSTVSEFYPCPSRDGRWLFYEKRENAGNAIAVYDTQQKTHRVLKFSRPAKEPCYSEK